MLRNFLLYVIIYIMVSMATAVHFDHKFQYRMCDDLHCVDPIWVRGPCSLSCPQGQTCRHPWLGTVLKAGVVHDINGQKCRCKDTWYPDWHIAYCTE